MPKQQQQVPSVKFSPGNRGYSQGDSFKYIYLLNETMIKLYVSIAKYGQDLDRLAWVRRESWSAALKVPVKLSTVCG